MRGQRIPRASEVIIRTLFMSSGVYMVKKKLSYRTIFFNCIGFLVTFPRTPCPEAFQSLALAAFISSLFFFGWAVLFFLFVYFFQAARKVKAADAAAAVTPVL